MSKIKALDVAVAGSGGSKKGHNPVEADDTLRSKSMVTLVDLLSEGRIGGLVDGDKSIYLDGIPLRNADGSENFPGTATEFRHGEVNQAPLSTLEDSGSAYTVGVEVKKDSAYVLNVSSQDIDKVRVIIGLPGLFEQTDKGDVNGTAVEYSFSLSVDGSPFYVVSDENGVSTARVDGKTRSKTQRSHTIRLPKFNTSCRVRVNRETPDSTTSMLVNGTFVDGYVEIIESSFIYPHTALVGIRLDSELFSSIPQRSYDLKGIEVKIPGNYDPVHGTYTGAWDGSFYHASTSNPAWILYDLLLSERYGLGRYIKEHQVDKASFYKAARYCDEAVPDGYGGMERRFTINTEINTQVEAYRLLTDIASVFRSSLFWAESMAQLTQDSPTAPSVIFNQSNVSPDGFSYSGTARKDRHSVAIVTWNDPRQNWKQVPEYVEDRDLIERYGVRETSVVAFGCTSRGQAHRVGRWLLYSEASESNLITFNVGLDAAMLMPGEVVKIHDSMRAGKRMGGRIKEMKNLTSCTIDQPLVIGAQARVSIMMPDGTFVERPIKQAAGATVTQLTWDSPLATMPAANAVFVLRQSNLEPLLARVVGVKQNDDDKSLYTITAVEHNPNKYASIDLGVDLEIPPTTIEDPRPDAPKNLTFSTSRYIVAGETMGIKGVLSWEGASPTYIVRYRRKSNPWKQETVTAPVFEFHNVEVATYEFEVQARSPLGKLSAIATYTHDVEEAGVKPGTVVGLALETPYTGNELKVKWDKTPGANSYEVQLYSPYQDRIVRTTKVGNVLRYEYSVDDAKADGGPFRTLIVRVRALDILGTPGDWAEITASNGQIPMLTGIKVEPGVRSIFATFDRPTDPDYAGFIIWVSKEPGFTPNESNAVYDGIGTMAFVQSLKDGTPLDGKTTYYVRLAGYDTYDKNELNISSEIAVNPVSLAPGPEEITNEMLEKGLLDLTKFAEGIEPVGIVDELPDPATHTRPAVMLLKTDGKVYRLVDGKWTASIPTVDLVGTVKPEQIEDRSLDASKFATGVEPLHVVDALPPVAGYAGPRVVMLRTDGKLYRYDNGKWNTKIVADDIQGQLKNDQLAAIEAGKVTGQLTDAQIKDLNAAKLAGQIKADAIPKNAITADKFAVGLEPISTVKTLPTVAGYTGPKVVMLEGDGKLYRLTNGQWKSNVEASDVAGQLREDQIAAIAASKITGQLTAAQIKELEAAKITGQLAGDQIKSGAIDYTKFETGTEPIKMVSALPAVSGYVGPKVVMLQSDGKLYRLTGGKWEKNIPTSDLSGTIAGTQLANAAVEAAKIADGAVTVNKIAANSITASKLVLTDSSNIYPDYNLMDPTFYTGPGTFAGTNYQNFSARRWSMPPSTEATEALTGWFVLEANADYSASGAAHSSAADAEATLLIETGTFDGTSGVITPQRRIQVLKRRTQDTNIEYAELRTTSNERRARFVMQRGAGGSSHASFSGFVVRRKANAQMIVDGAVTADKVAATSIVAGKLAAGSVIAEKIATDAVTAGKIQAGAVTASKIAANAITAKHMLVSDTTNLVPDGNWEDTDPGNSFATIWETFAKDSNANPHFATAAGYTRTGARSLVLQKRLEVSTAEVSFRLRPEYAIPVTAGEALHFETEIFTNSGPNPAGFYFRVWWLDEKKASLSYQDIATNAAVPSAWTVHSGKLTAPSAAKYVSIQIYSAQQNTTAANLIIDRIVMRRANAATLIVDGSIGAQHIAADSITAKHLVVSDSTNLLLNDFTTGTLDGWTIGNGGQLKNQTQNANMAQGSWEFFSNAIDQAISAPVTCLQGDTYYVSVWAYNPSTFASSLVLQAANSVGDIKVDTVIASHPASSPTWRKVEGTFTVPASKSQLRVILRSERASAGGAAVNWAKPVLRRMASSELIVDGAVIANKIATNAITADKIAAKAITTEKLAAGAVEAASIAAGAVTAEKVAANTISARELILTDFNDIILDPQFERGLESFGTVNTGVSRWTAADADVPAGAPANTGVKLLRNAVRFVYTNPVPVQPDQTWVVRADAIAQGVGLDFKLSVQVFRADGTILGYPQTTFGAISTTAWQPLEATLKMPVGACQARFRIISEGGVAGSGAYYITNWSVKQAYGASLIVNGAITTDKLSANAVTAGKIAANAISAENLQADAITAKHIIVSDLSNLVMNDFTTGTLDGWTFPNGTPRLKSTPANAALSQGIWEFYSDGRDQAQSRVVSVRPGEVYHFSAYCYNTTSYTASIMAVTRDGASGSTSYHKVVTHTPKTGFYLIEGSFTIPAGKSQLHLLLQSERPVGTGVGENIFWAKPVLRRMASAELIVDGAISADKVAADSISAKHLIISDTSNLVINDFTTGSLDGWGVTGGGQIKNHAPNASTPQGAWEFSSNNRDQAVSVAVSCAPGDVFYASAWHYNPDSGHTSNLMIRHTDANNGTISHTSLANVPSAPNASWRKIEGTFTVPAGKSRIRLLLQSDRPSSTTGNGLVVYWAKPVLRKMASAELIVDGAITAVKISSGAIETDKLAASAVVADKLSANAVTAVKIAAGAVETAKIAAGAITAEKIAANSITARELVLTDFNDMVLDPKFEKGTAQFAAANSLATTWAVTDADVPVGAPANTGLRFPRDQTNAVSVTLPTVPVIPGQVWYMSADAVGVGAGRSILLSAQLLRHDGTLHSWFNPQRGSIPTWQRISETLTVPEGVGFARFRITSEAGASPAVGFWYVTNWSIKRMYGAELIVDGAITTDKLSANAVTAAKIAAGAITAEKIAADSITAKHIVIGDFTNLASGSDFESDATNPWDVAGKPRFVVDATKAHTGARSLKVGPTSLGGNANLTLGTKIDVNPGEVYYAEFWAIRDAAFNGGGTGNAKLRFGNQNGTLVADLQFNVQTVSDTKWTKLAKTFEIPENATALNVTIVTDNSAGYVWLDNIVIRRMTGSELIVDGSISADKITSRAITTDKLDAGAVVADKIDANAVTTDKLSTNAVTSDKIAANAITADKLDANSVTAGKIAAGAISADQIAVNAITAKHLNISDFTNLIPDDQLQDAGSWTLHSSTTLAAVSGLGFNSRGRFEYQRVAGSGYLQIIQSRPFPVATGDEFFASIQTTRSSGSRYNFWYRIHWLKADGTAASTDYTTVRSGPTTAAGMQKYDAHIKNVPSNAAQGYIKVYVEQSQTDGDFFLGGMEVRKKSNGNLLVDGAITADKIAGATITGDKLVANTIMADRINTNSLNTAVANIVNANITTATISWAQINNVQSTNYLANQRGYRIDPNGSAEFNGLKARGEIMGGAFTAMAWPANNGRGFYLGPDRLMIGNWNNGNGGGWVEMRADGFVSMPGLNVTNGRLSITELNVIGNAQIANLSVNDMKIANGAVSNFASLTYAQPSRNLRSWNLMGTTYINTHGASSGGHVSLIIMAHASGMSATAPGSGRHSFMIRLYENGNVVRDLHLRVPGTLQSNDNNSVLLNADCSLVTSLHGWGGSYQIDLYKMDGAGDLRVENFTLTALAVRK